MQPPARILFIGNSYTQRNDLPGLLTALAEGAAGRLETRSVIAGGASLRQHWNQGRAAELIRGAGWDEVVLQEQSTLPVKNAARYLENVRLFAPLIREHGARPLFYLPWARRAAPDSQVLLNEAVAAAAAETGGSVAPVGPAWVRAMADPGVPELYDPDGSHPTLAGSYLAACVFFAVLWKRSPEGLPAPARLDPTSAGALQRHAWQTVNAAAD